MVLTETYENANHFDLTYLMFVWIAFLPTAIIPWIYASLVLPQHVRERFYSFLGLPTQATQLSNKKKKRNQTNSCEEESSGMLEISSSVGLNPPRIVSTMEADDDKYRRKRSIGGSSRRSQQGRYVPRSTVLSDEISINNSCSNITASTYCINSTERESAHFEISPLFNYNDKRSSLKIDLQSLTSNTPRGSFRSTSTSKKVNNNNPNVPSIHSHASALLHEKRGSFASTAPSLRKDSTTSSTLERDHEIIDLLERERSMTNFDDLFEAAQVAHQEQTPPLPQPSQQPLTRLPSRKGSRKLPKSPRDPPLALPSAAATNTVPDITLSVSRRTSYDLSDPLQVVDRKIMRTVSNDASKVHQSSSSSGSHQYDLIDVPVSAASSRLRRHSSEKYHIQSRKDENIEF